MKKTSVLFPGQGTQAWGMEVFIEADRGKVLSNLFKKNKRRKNND